MAHDLFIVGSKRNFARDTEITTPVSDEVTITFSDDEKQMLSSAADLRMKAEAGDADAKKRMVAFTKNVAKLKSKASKGDPKAKRTLLVLRESGLFNGTQTFALGWNPFAAKTETLSERAARAAKFSDAVKSASKSEDFAKLSEMAKYDQALKEQLLVLAQKGSNNALKVAAYTAKPSAAVVGWNPFKKLYRGVKSGIKATGHGLSRGLRATEHGLKDVALIVPQALSQANFASALSQGDAVRGSDNRSGQVRRELERLRLKNPKTADEQKTVEQLEERLARIEAMSGIGYGPMDPARRAARHARRARKLAQLKARAAAGDQRAIARLQQMQQQLLAPPPAIAPVTTPSSIYTPPPSALPTATPINSPSYQPPAYTPTTYTPPPYQPPYVPPYYQDADGNYYQTQPQPGQGQPTIDVFVGQRSRRRDEEDAAEREDRGNMGWYGNSFVGGAAVCGNAIPHDNYRVAVMKAAVKSAGGGRPSTKDYFAAKAAVDKVIGKSGITIYMPGAKPGRRTI